MHYGSNPLAKGTVNEFLQAMKNSKSKIIQMVEGQTLEF